MTNLKRTRWLLVALAIVGLSLGVPVVSAHGDQTAAGDTPMVDGAATDWATWMETQMTDHMGPESVDWMEAHMGVTVDEMTRDMADNDDRGWRYGRGHC